MLKRCFSWFCPRLAEYYTFIMVMVMLIGFMVYDVSATSVTPAPSAVAGGTDIWTKANSLIVDIYNKIAGISTVLAGLMSAIAVIGAKMSNNQHKVDAAWDWFKRIWIAWAVINGIGAFIAYLRPIFEGLNRIDGQNGNNTLTERMTVTAYSSVLFI